MKTPRCIAFVTSRALSGLTEDDRRAIDPLRALGVRVAPAVWDDDSVDWEDFDSVVLRSCWDYHTRPREFLQWLAELEQRSVVLWNPASVIRWNIDKAYLLQLEKQEIPIVPTVRVDCGTALQLDTILARQEWERAVVKPSISASGFNTWLTSRDSAARDEKMFQDMVQRGSVLVQRFLPEICTAGEWSFVFYLGRYSHAVLKTPGQGEFLCQEELGGTVKVARPSLSLIDQASRVVRASKERCLYSRVDGVVVDGRLVIIEFELIEPSLYLAWDAQAANRFADAMVEIL